MTSMLTVLTLTAPITAPVNQATLETEQRAMV